MDTLIITPKTKIYDLLNTYPQLEEVLITLAPQFIKLKNPLLRKTITKITSLSQAAVIAGIKVEEMINKLRSEVGQTTSDTVESDTINYTTEKPLWYDETKVISNIDIRDMLNAGEQPVHEVLSAIKHLKENEIIKVIAPFIPAPLIEKSLSMNYQHWLVKKNEEEFWVYFKN